jgi:hypothetical protein
MKRSPPWGAAIWWGTFSMKICPVAALAPKYHALLRLMQIEVSVLV